MPDASGEGVTTAKTGSTGTTISYRDSATATSTFHVDVQTPGLISHGKCVKESSVPKKLRAKDKHCKALVSKGKFTRRDHIGANSLHFTGRFTGGPLAPGKYVLEAAPRLQGAPHAGATVSVDFEVLAPPKKETSGTTSSGGSTTSGESTSPPGESPTKTEPGPCEGSTAGTLIIDDGFQGNIPADDGTPLYEGSSAPSMALCLRGDARVYATDAHYAKIAISGGARLTPTPPEKLPARTLKVTTGELEVAAGARIEADGIGYAGAHRGTEFGSAPSGVRPAGYDAGGSHGGAGGLNEVEAGEKPAATYDSPSDPTEPGGGGGGGGGGDGDDDDHAGTSGGGVILVEATTLILDGLIQADGENEEGPTVEEPFEYGAGAATGAGGSIQLHAQTLSGDGSVEADGGTACMIASERIDGEPFPCTEVPVGLAADQLRCSRCSATMRTSSSQAQAHQLRSSVCCSSP